MASSAFRHVVIPAVVANLPLVFLLIVHFPNYNTGFRLLIIHLASQYLFLLLFFPLSAFLVARSGLLVTPLFGLTQHHYKSVSHVGWLRRCFLEPRYLPRCSWIVLGLAVGVAFGCLDFEATSVDYDHLKPPKAVAAAFAMQISVDAAARGDSRRIIDSVERELKRSKPALDVYWLVDGQAGFSNCWSGKDLREAPAHECVFQISRCVERGLKRNLDGNALRATQVLEDVGPDTFAESSDVVASVAYLQTIMHPTIRESFLVTGSWLLHMLNFLELIAVGFVGTQLFRWAFGASCLRFLIRDEASEVPIRQLGYHLAFATLFLAAWPPLRVLTEEEVKLVNPGAEALGAPWPVFSYIAGMAVMSTVVCVGKKQLVTTLVVVIGAVVHVAAFCVSVFSVFTLRGFIVRGTPAATFLLWLIAYSAWVTVVFTFLWLGSVSGTNQTADGDEGSG